jgi:hypothetical protein
MVLVNRSNGYQFDINSYKHSLYFIFKTVVVTKMIIILISAIVTVLLAVLKMLISALVAKYCTRRKYERSDRYREDITPETICETTISVAGFAATGSFSG